MNPVIDKFEECESDSIVSNWICVLTEADMDVRGAKINEFIQRYAMNASETAQRYLDKAMKELDRIADEKEARKDWFDAKQTNTILGYVDFITRHPYSEYREEADRLIQEMKGDLLTDMMRFPFKYNRETMYDYISTNALTMNDLVYASDILTDRAYNHIRRYPRIYEELECLPESSIDDTENNIIKGNVDVLFFGVCGSGGKTCLMASLMSLLGESSDFLYQEFHNNKACDNTYGQYLAEYLKTDRLPPATDSTYIQVVKTLIRHNGKYRGVSFIEFAGEQVSELAGNSVADGLFDEVTIPSLIKILNNPNKKIIFLTLDPTNLKNVQICGPDDDLWVSQADALSCVISNFNNAPKFMRNVIGFHTIISKSDTWLQGPLDTSIDSAIELLGGKGLLLQIEQLCNTYKINGISEPIPFSIGRFMPGNTYEFDDSDAKKLLRLIRKDIEASDKNRSTLSRIKNYFNS